MLGVKITLLILGFLLGFMIRANFEEVEESQDGKRIDELSDKELESLHEAVESERYKRYKKNPFDEFKEKL